jgi:hypothetical protein
MFLHSGYGGISMGKGKNITVILRNGMVLTFKDPKVVEGKKTWIYQVNSNEHPEELLALLDPQHIETLSAEN